MSRAATLKYCAPERLSTLAKTKQSELTKEFPNYSVSNVSNSRSSHLIGPRIFGAQTDLWSLGVMLLECTNLEYPFNDNPSQLLNEELFSSILGNEVKGTCIHKIA